MTVGPWEVEVSRPLNCDSVIIRVIQRDSNFHNPEKPFTRNLSPDGHIKMVPEGEKFSDYNAKPFIDISGQMIAEIAKDLVRAILEICPGALPDEEKDSLRVSLELARAENQRLIKTVDRDADRIDNLIGTVQTLVD